MNPAHDLLPTVVYRFFDVEGTLLYVGLSGRLADRLELHRRKDWWQKVATIAVAHYPDRASAREAELLALEFEAPRFNSIRECDKLAARAARSTDETRAAA